MDRPYYDYATYLRSQFGARTYKVSVEGGFSCPNIDGTVAKGGCTYCNNKSFVPGYLSRRMDITEQLEKGIRFQRERYGAKKFLAYLQAFSNTYGQVDELEALYRQVLSHPGIEGLVIGTRADCLPDPVLDLLEELAADRYVALEVGIESIYDETLERINRGHNFAAVRDAFARLEGRGIHLATHLIFGFPEEERSQWLHSVDVINDFPLDYIKFHHLHIVRGTQMARRYRRKPFDLFSFDAWIALVCDALERLSPEIAVARLSGSADPNLLIAPTWNRNHSDVVRAVMEELERRSSRQGLAYPDHAAASSKQQK